MLKNKNEDKKMLFAMLEDWREHYGIRVLMQTIIEWLKG